MDRILTVSAKIAKDTFTYDDLHNLSRPTSDLSDLPTSHTPDKPRGHLHEWFSARPNPLIYLGLLLPVAVGVIA